MTETSRTTAAPDGREYPAASRPPVRAVLVGVLVGLAAMALAWPLAPQTAAVPGADRGDAALAEQARALLGDTAAVGGMAVAVVDDGTVRSAAVGARDAAGTTPLRPDDPMEIGSIAKALTGMLLADLAAEGVVALDQSVADALDLDDPGLAGVTLEELATHRSGLPRLPADRLLASGRFVLFGGDPYRGQCTSDVIAAAAGRSLPEDDRDHSYSNLGFAVLGQALATAAEQPYADLIADRIAEPLGLEGLRVADSVSALPADPVTGRTAGGAAMAPWVSDGYAPAGMIWASAEDLAILLEGILAGDAPGVDATRPVAPTGTDRHAGLGWVIDDDGTIWHNGRTGGFSAWAGVRPDANQAAVVLARTDASVDAIGRALLDSGAPGGEATIEAVAPGPGLFDLGLFVIAIPLWLAAYTVVIARRGRQADRPLDRIDIAGMLVTVVYLLALTRTLGAWQVAPLGWLLLVGVTAGALGSLLARVTTLPVTSGPSAARRWTAAAFNAVAATALLVLPWWP